MPHWVRIAAVCVTAAVFALLSPTHGVPARIPSDDLASLPPDREAECAGDNPYLVTVCYRGGASSAVIAREPAVVAFRDTASDAPHYKLATYRQVGAVYGLAFSPREIALYAAAFHKRQIPFGPGGPGAVYRIDLVSGDVAHAFTVPNAGPDRHAAGLDRRAGPYAGKTSLGDIDLSADGTELYVVNLEDRRIYRFRLPDGQMLGSFSHGASDEPWAEEARPFGLAIRNGLIYHAVVRSAETNPRRADMARYIYESAPDGTGMRRVAESALEYERGWLNPFLGGYREISADWLPWTDRPSNLISDYRATFAFVHPMPMGSDIVFGAAGDLVAGLRDRAIDMMPVFTGDSMPDPVMADSCGFGAGDIVLGRGLQGEWRLDPSPEHFDDDFRFNDEPTLGGLAALDATGAIVSNGWGDNDRLDLTIWGETPSVLWFDAAGGGKIHFEAVCRTYGPQPQLALPGIGRAWADNEGPGYAGSMGDVEVLCGEAVTPTTIPPTTPATTPTPTPSPIASLTPTRALPTSTATHVSSPTMTPLPSALYLPVALREHCESVHERSDIALLVDTSSSMTGQKIDDARAAALSFVDLIDLAPGRSQVAVVRFDREAEVVRELTNARAPLESAIRSLQVRSGTHIDKGLRTALGELQSPRHLARNAQVLILLTDGVQTGTPGEEVRAAVEVLAAGIRVYTIGLGADVDEATLRTIAGDDERYYFAPDSGDLARIYSEIARDLMCPGEKFWGGR